MASDLRYIYGYLRIFTDIDVTERGRFRQVAARMGRFGDLRAQAGVGVSV